MYWPRCKDTNAQKNRERGSAVANPEFATVNDRNLRPLRGEMLPCALALTGRATPTAAELATALTELYPDGSGPTVADVLAAGWLVPTIDGQALREPPLTPAEAAAQLAVAETFDNSRHSPAPALANSRPETGESREKAANTAPRFSYYRGGITATTPHAAITVGQLYTVLTSPRARARTEALRALPREDSQRNNLKRGLDYVTPAGTFTRRANDELETASGLMVLDFDHLPDVPTARAVLLADEMLAPELLLLFTSPSGDGLKAFVQTDPSAAHLDNFRAYADYLGRKYAALGLQPDEAGKDIARACFVPYAPDAWLAPAHGNAG